MDLGVNRTKSLYAYMGKIIKTIEPSLASYATVTNAGHYVRVIIRHLVILRLRECMIGRPRQSPSKCSGSDGRTADRIWFTSEA